MARTQGIHHVGLTVPSVRETSAFFLEVLGFDEVGGRPEYPSIFVSDGEVMLTLWQVQDPAGGVAFDRKRCVGLHHLALRVKSGAQLQELHQQLAGEQGVEIEFAPEALGATGLMHMMCAIPGGVRVEFVAPA